MDFSTAYTLEEDQFGDKVFSCSQQNYRTQRKQGMEVNYPQKVFKSISFLR